MNMCVLSLWKGAFCVIFALDRGWVKTCFRKDDGMRHRKKLALFLALCVGAGSLVITTREGKPVRAAEAAVEEPVGGLRTWQGTQVSWSEAQKFQTNQSGLSVSSAASQDLPDYVKKSGNDYGYRKLSAKEKEAYDSLYASALEVVAGKQDIAAGSNGVYYGLTCTFGSGTVASKQKLWEILTSFVADHPEFYWIGSTFAYSISGSGEVKKIMLQMDEDYVKASDRAKYDAQIDKNLARVTALTNTTTDVYEKVRIVHDWIVSRIDYAYVSGTSTPEDSAWAHNIIGVMSDSYKAGVCESYADTFAFILSTLGIPNLYVQGDGITGSGGGGHAWNMVSFDGGETYCDMDLTWDDLNDGCEKDSKVCHYNWFAMPDSRFTKAHEADTSSSTGSDWLYDLPDAVDTMEYTYYQKHSAMANGDNVYDTVSAKAFLKKAANAAKAPNDQMPLIISDSTVFSLLQQVDSNFSSYYKFSTMTDGKVPYEGYIRYVIVNRLAHADATATPTVTPTATATPTATPTATATASQTVIPTPTATVKSTPGTTISEKPSPTNQTPAGETRQGTTAAAEDQTTQAPQQTVESTLTVKGQKYSLKDAAKKTVVFTGMTNKKKTSLSIPSAVRYKGVIYRVTEIGAKACAGNKKLKKVTIGSKIVRIRTNAFSGCVNLKKIVIKSKKITKMDSGAFKKTSKKAVVSLPKTKYKKYKTMMKKAGARGRYKKA